MILGIGHVGIIVKDLDEAIDLYCKRLGIDKMTEVSEQPDDELRNVMLGIGTQQLELIEPYPGTSLAKFMEKHGEGMHHVNLIVDDLDSIIETLEANGATIIKRGAESAFVHPNSTKGVLIEIVHANVLKRLNIPLP